MRECPLRRPFIIGGAFPPDNAVRPGFAPKLPEHTTMSAPDAPTDPADEAAPAPPRPFGLRDVAGLVAGFALAARLFRHSEARSAQGAALLIFAALYLWTGLAMSGPIVLWLGRLGDPGALPPREPERWGRPIGEVPVHGRRRSRPAAVPRAPRRRSRLLPTLWMMIGSLWIAAMLGFGGNWPIFSLLFLGCGLIPGMFTWVSLGSKLVEALGPGAGDVPARTWEDHAAAAVVIGWPIAGLLGVILDRLR